MLLVSVFVHLGRKNGAKRSTRDDATREMSEYDAWFCVYDFGNKNVKSVFPMKVVLYCAKKRAIYSFTNLSCGRLVPGRVARFCISAFR